MTWAQITGPWRKHFWIRTQSHTLNAGLECWGITAWPQPLPCRGPLSTRGGHLEVVWFPFGGRGSGRSWSWRGGGCGAWIKGSVALGGVGTLSGLHWPFRFLTRLSRPQGRALCPGHCRDLGRSVAPQTFGHYFPLHRHSGPPQPPCGVFALTCVLQVGQRSLGGGRPWTKPTAGNWCGWICIRVSLTPDPGPSLCAGEISREFGGRTIRLELRLWPESRNLGKRDQGVAGGSGSPVGSQGAPGNDG